MPVRTTVQPGARNDPGRVARGGAGWRSSRPRGRALGERARPLMLPPPPVDPAQLEDFPSRSIPVGYPYATIHDQWNEPEWFCWKATSVSWFGPRTARLATRCPLWRPGDHTREGTVIAFVRAPSFSLLSSGGVSGTRCARNSAVWQMPVRSVSSPPSAMLSRRRSRCCPVPRYSRESISAASRSRSRYGSPLTSIATRSMRPPVNRYGGPPG